MTAIEPTTPTKTTAPRPYGSVGAVAESLHQDVPASRKKHAKATPNQRLSWRKLASVPLVVDGLLAGDGGYDRELRCKRDPAVPDVGVEVTAVVIGVVPDGEDKTR